MAKEAFWQHKELMRGNLRISTKKRMLECYVLGSEICLRKLDPEQDFTKAS